MRHHWSLFGPFFRLKRLASREEEGLWRLGRLIFVAVAFERVVVGGGDVDGLVGGG